MGLIQYLMFTANIVFWAIGGTMLGVGIWMAVDESAKDMALVAGSAGMNEDVYWAAVYLMISIGAVVFVIGFFGCCGAMNPEKKIYLKLYFFIVKFIILVELISLILCGVFWDSLTDSVQRGMSNDAIHKYGHAGNETLTRAWDKMQQRWECCGGYSYTDYRLNPYFNTSITPNSHPVPVTCCVANETDTLIRCYDDARASLNTSTSLYTKNCYEGLRGFIDENSTILITITCVFIGLQIFGSFCACLLLRKGNN